VYQGEFFGNRGGAQRYWLDRVTAKDGTNQYRALVVSQDHALTLLQGGSVEWTREEALAHVQQAIFVEVTTEAGTLGVPGFAARITPKISFLTQKIAALPNAVRNSVQKVLAPKDAAFTTPRQKEFSQILVGGLVPEFEELEPHTFGFRKIILLPTKAGKLFALNSMSGAIIWQQYLGGDKVKKVYLVHPRKAVVFTRGEAGDGALTLDPLTGSRVTDLHTFPTPVEQVLSLPLHADDGQKVLLVVDTRNQVTVLPNTAAVKAEVGKRAKAIFFHRTSISEGVIRGYQLQMTQDGSLEAVELWTSVFPKGQEEISSVSTRDPLETVNSAVRITSAKTYLQKYLNPNLLVVATQRRDQPPGVPLLPSVKRGSDPSINVYFLDGANGRLLEKVVHRGAQGPVHTVATENMVVYSYFNTAANHFELSVVDLYEDPDVIIPERDEEFSSFREDTPILQQQAYVFQNGVSAMGVTQTARGISNKMFLVGLQSDQLLGLPRGALDPQRPTGTPSDSDKYQGLLPYSPEITAVTTSIISHTHTIHRLEQIVASAVELESTSLVFAFGLDLFHSRVQGSGAFDLLNEDFNYFFLILSVTSLSLGVFLASKFASKKRLNALWK